MALLQYGRPASSRQIPVNHCAGYGGDGEEDDPFDIIAQNHLTDTEQGPIDEDAAAQPVEQIPGEIVRNRNVMSTARHRTPPRGGWTNAAIEAGQRRVTFGGGEVRDRQPRHGGDGNRN